MRNKTNVFVRDNLGMKLRKGPINLSEFKNKSVVVAMYSLDKQKWFN